MSFEPRLFDEIARDLLTTLTGGTVRESLPAPPEGVLLVPTKLKSRPVRRVSHLQGFVGPHSAPRPYRFTAADFELVSSSGDGSLDAIRFRESGRKPTPLTPLVINYYPMVIDPVPLTDLNVGSVTRTLLETVARELAVLYQQMQIVYDSAFVETARGPSLDSVVALAGVRRLPPGHPVAWLEFTRKPGTHGRITIPPGTAVSDSAGNRYLTTASLTLEPEEPSREITAMGESVATPAVEAGELTRIEIQIAGIVGAINRQPARALGNAETDDELRRRARAAFHGTVRGTLDALRFGIASIPDVNTVSITEMPFGVPGEVRIDVAYKTETPEAVAEVDRMIEEMRPAGIRVLRGGMARLRALCRVELVLEGSGVSSAELAELKSALEAKLRAHLSAVSPGGKIRASALSSILLTDSRVVDGRVVLLPDGAPESADLSLPASTALDLAPGFDFRVETETGPTALGSSMVSIALPLHLAAGISQAEAQAAIDSAATGYLAARSTHSPLTTDSFVAAVRDETRFAIVRSEVLITIETFDQRFLQLTDGVGSYAPESAEKLVKGPITLEAREGSA